MNAEIKRIKLP